MTDATVVAMRITSRLVLGAVIILTVSKCSLLIGDISPPTEKSARYTVPRIDLQAPQTWKLQSRHSELNQADWIFNHRLLNSHISVTSSCRPRVETSERNLRDYRKELLIGFNRHTILSESETPMQNQRARLVTTVSAVQSSVSLTLKIVQILEDDCLYDLVYLSRPEDFARHEADFDRFTQQFKVH